MLLCIWFYSTLFCFDYWNRSCWINAVYLCSLWTLRRLKSDPMLCLVPGKWLLLIWIKMNITNATKWHESWTVCKFVRYSVCLELRIVACTGSSTVFSYADILSTLRPIHDIWADTYIFVADYIAEHRTHTLGLLLVIMLPRSWVIMSSYRFRRRRRIDFSIWHRHCFL